MGHRGRLLVAAVASTVATGVLAVLVVVPVVFGLRRRLQAGYDAADTGVAETVRHVGSEYFAAGLWALSAVAIVLFCAGAVHVAVTTPPARRNAVPRDLARPAAGLLVAQAPLSVAADVWGSYSSAASAGGVALGVAGAAVLVLERGPRWASALACLVAGAATLAVARPAVLLLPLSTGLAGLLIAAAATHRVPGATDRETAAAPT